MSSFKDKTTNKQRLYVWSVPMAFLVVFGVFLLGILTGVITDVEMDGKSGVLSNIWVSVISAYLFACECTIVHFMLGKIRTQQEGFVKALLMFLFVPALIAGLFASVFLTIPYCIYCGNKIKQIKVDDNGILLSWQKWSLIFAVAADIVIIILYFVLQK